MKTPRRSETRLRVAYSPESNNPLDQRGLRHYALVDPLPPVCIDHGRPAVGEHEATIQFEGTHRIDMWTRMTSYMAASERDPLLIRRERPEADSAVHAAWPICRRCAARIKIREFTFLFLVFATICLIVGLYAAAQFGLRDTATVLAFAVFFGAPAIVSAIVAVFTSPRPVRHVRRVADRSHLLVHAHRRFTEALPAPDAAAAPEDRAGD